MDKIEERARLTATKVLLCDNWIGPAVGRQGWITQLIREALRAQDAESRKAQREACARAAMDAVSMCSEDDTALGRATKVYVACMDAEVKE
jgi:hypothetical protein